MHDIFQTIPRTRVGLDVNPQFNSIFNFDSALDTAAEEVSLFGQAGVPLVHSWVIDNQDPELYGALVQRTGSYDQATLRMTEADALVNGLLLTTDASFEGLVELCQDKVDTLTPEQKLLLQDGVRIRDFLFDNNAQQLSLFDFVSKLEPGSLAAYFRANHVSVLYRAKVRGPSVVLAFGDNPH